MIFWARIFALCTTLMVLLMAPIVAMAQGNPDQKIVEAAKREGELVYYTTITLSKEGQEMLRGFQRIPVRKDVEADPPRLFRGFKIAVEDPEDYKDFDASVKQYLEIFKLR